jgi:long-chain acyl-CoA synthetase
MNKYIEEVVIIGDRKPYCVALIVPSFDVLEDMAKKEGIAYSSKEELLENPRIKTVIDEAIAEVNRGLARYETIKKFALIPTLFTQETGELTPTLKVKRWAVEKKYQGIVEQLYEIQTTKLAAEA